jgi:hypothetical protein
MLPATMANKENDSRGIAKTENYKNAFSICIFLIAISITLLSFAVDDGLRHLGAAFSDFKSWGDVYPFSVFEEFEDYDPWFGYDFSLRLIAHLVKQVPISPLTLKYCLAKIIAGIFLCAFLYLATKRSKIIEHIHDQSSFTVAIILVFLLGFPLGRMTTIRPFVFGTLYLLYSIGERGIIKGATAAMILTFFYPYLSWFYIIPIGLSHFLKGDKRFALGSMVFIIPYLALQPTSFWGLQAALLKSEVTRNSIYTTSISEFAFSLNSFFFYMYLFFVFISYPFFSVKARSLNFLNLTILIYMVPAIRYVRYFIDLIIPLLFVQYGTEYLCLLLEPYNKLVQSWKKIFNANLMKANSILKFGFFRSLANKSDSEREGKTSLKPYIILVYLALFSVSIATMLNEISSFKRFQDVLSSVPNKELVLTDFNSQYRILFVRPDLRVVPSCELGFPSRMIYEEYLAYFNEGRIGPLSRKTGAEFFLESKSMYLHPRDAGLLKLVSESRTFMLWKISGVAD